MKTFTENKLYTSMDLETELHIAENTSVLIFDEGDVLEKVTFGKNASLKYFSYFSTEAIFQKTFLVNGENSRCEVYSLLSSTGEKITAKIEGKLMASGSYLDMHIVSFVSDGGIIDLDGIVNIVEGVEKVEGYLKEENIFLGSTGKVRGLPTLLVHSNDVKAAHACNMEKISDEKLFYLRSRGLPREDAAMIMLDSYIRKTFQGLERLPSLGEGLGESLPGEVLYQEVRERILNKIKSK